MYYFPIDYPFMFMPPLIHCVQLRAPDAHADNNTRVDHNFSNSLTFFSEGGMSERSIKVRRATTKRFVPSIFATVGRPLFLSSEHAQVNECGLFDDEHAAHAEPMANPILTFLNPHSTHFFLF